MEENENIVSEDTKQFEQDVVLDEVNQESSAQAVPKDNTQDNLRRLREARDRSEREKAILEDRLKQYTSREETPKQDLEYGDEDFVEGRHLKKEMESIKKQLHAYKQQQVSSADETRLKSVYADFEKVVNPETIQRLKELDPETAETIATSNASLYARGAAAYKRIKEIGAYVEDNHKQDREKAQANIAKPRPLNSVSPQQGDSPLAMANAFANGLTPELKKQLWKEMNEATKRL